MVHRREKILHLLVPRVRIDGTLVLGATAGAPAVNAAGITEITAPAVSPAYIGVGYIFGPELSALSFSGGVLAWGLMVKPAGFKAGTRYPMLLRIHGGPNGQDQHAFSFERELYAANGYVDAGFEKRNNRRETFAPHFADRLAPGGGDTDPVLAGTVLRFCQFR